MNKLRIAAFSALVVGALLYSQIGTVLANTDGENAILGFLRVTVISYLQGLQGSFQQTENIVNGRFDSVDAKLDRIYASCSRTVTPTRRVTTAQVNTCVNACFTSTTIGTPGDRAIDPARFVACVSRCPSNTLRNQECAQRYTRMAAGTAFINGQASWVAFTPAGYSRICIAGREARFAGSCQVYADTISAGLTSCLVDQQVYTCQQDCDGNYRNPEGYTLCTLRCNNRARATETYEGLRASGFINEQGRLGINTVSNTSIENVPTAQPTTPVIPALPTAETYSQCVYRCDSDRTSCLALVPQPTTCQSSYDSCYTGCTTRLVTGGAAR